MVSESDIGIDGYAAMVISMAAKPKAKAAAKKAAAKKPANPTLDAEKFLKGLLATDSTVEFDLKKVENDFADESWAESLMKEISEAQQAKEDIKEQNDAFIKGFASAALNQHQLKAFKREIKDWDQTVFNAVRDYKEAVEKFQNLVQKAKELSTVSEASSSAAPSREKAKTSA